MEITTHLGDVRFLDCEVVLAGIFEDERPPQALAGQVDWFLYGQLTELLLSGRFAGRMGETALVASQGRILPAKFLIAGLGEKSKLGAAVLKEALPGLLGNVALLRPASAALEVLGTGAPSLASEEAARLLVSALTAPGAAPPADRVVILPADEGQQASVEKLLW